MLLSTFREVLGESDHHSLVRIVQESRQGHKLLDPQEGFQAADPVDKNSHSGIRPAGPRPPGRPDWFKAAFDYGELLDAEGALCVIMVNATMQQGVV